MTSGHSGNAEPVCHRDVLRYCFLPQRQKKMPTGFESVGISVFLPEMLVPAEAERVLIIGFFKSDYPKKP